MLKGSLAIPESLAASWDDCAGLPDPRLVHEIDRTPSMRGPCCSCSQGFEFFARMALFLLPPKVSTFIRSARDGLQAYDATCWYLAA